MSKEQVSTDSVSDKDETITVAPLAKFDEDSANTSRDAVDAAATRRSLTTKQAPLATVEDDTDIDPAKVIQQSIK